METFDALLKQSDYFKDVIDTHRTAVAEVVAELLAALIEHDPTLLPVVAQSLTRIADAPHRPSLHGDRSLFVSAIKQSVQPAKRVQT